MREAIRKAVLSLFPEMSGGLHLPKYGRVVCLSESLTEENICDNFRQRYAVDVELLDANDKPDTKFPLLKNVLLPLSMAGMESGAFKYPDNGTRVVISFASGLPNKPFIMQLFPSEQSLPQVDVDEMLLQSKTGVFNKADRKGNIISNTYAKIVNKSHARETEAFRNSEQYQQSKKTVKGLDFEKVFNKVIEALGAVEIYSGGVFNLGSVDSLNLTTARDLQQTVAKKRLANIGAGDEENIKGNRVKTLEGDALEDITGKSESTVSESQFFKSPKTYIGSEQHNLLVLVSVLAQSVIDLASASASHTHMSAGSNIDHVFTPAPTPPPMNASAMSSAGSKAAGEKAKVDGITL